MEVAILCGGKGKRMGNVNKGLLEICGKTFIEMLYEELESLGRVYIVGRRKDFSHIGIFAYDDIFPNLGPLGGIYTAMSTSNSEYILFVPCDMPTFKKEHALYLERMLLESHSEISVFYTDRITPIPGIYRISLKNCIRKKLNKNNRSVIDLLKSHRTVAALVRDIEKLKNINTLEDYENLKNTLKCY